MCGAYLSHISAPQGGVGTHCWPEGRTRQEPAARGVFGWGGAAFGIDGRAGQEPAVAGNGERLKL